MATLAGKINWKRYIRQLFIMLVGAFIAGMAVTLFFLPVKLTMGGISGLAAVVYNVTGIPISVGILTTLLNLPVFLLGLLYVSKKFVIDSLIGTVVYSFMVDVCDWIVHRVGLEPNFLADASGHTDLFLSSMFGGALFGLGLGLMLVAGYTTGGTDIIAVIMRKKIHGLSLGMGIWIVDAIVIALSVLAYAKVEPDSLRLALYSSLALFLTSKAVDLVIEGFNYKRTAIIISSKSERIAQRIMAELDRGVTGLNGKGMYTNVQHTVLLCVLAQQQIRTLKRIASEEDEKAFIFLMDAREVLGEGFEGSDILA